jgi:hypothetical protein
VTKKLKESLSSVTAKLNDANYFLWKTAQNYFDLEIQKNDQVKKLIPYVTENY